MESKSKVIYKGLDWSNFYNKESKCLISIYDKKEEKVVNKIKTINTPITTILVKDGKNVCKNNFRK